MTIQVPDNYSPQVELRDSSVFRRAWGALGEAFQAGNIKGKFAEKGMLAFIRHFCHAYFMEPEDVIENMQGYEEMFDVWVSKGESTDDTPSECAIFGKVGGRVLYLLWMPKSFGRPGYPEVVRVTCRDNREVKDGIRSDLMEIGLTGEVEDIQSLLERRKSEIQRISTRDLITGDEVVVLIPS